MHASHLRLFFLLIGLLGLLAGFDATATVPPAGCDPIATPPPASDVRSQSFRFQPPPASPGEAPRILYLQDPIAERFIVQGVDADGCPWLFAAGRSLPFGQREIISPFPNMQLPSLATGTDVQITIQDRKTIRPWIKTAPRDSFLRESMLIWMGVAGYVSILLVVILVALGFATDERNNMTRAYILYIVSMLFWTLQNFGIGSAWVPFWPDESANAILQAIAVAVVVAGIANAILHFLDLRGTARRMIEVSVAMSSLSFLSSAWFDYGYRIGSALLAVLAIAVITALVRGYRRHDLSIRLFSFGLATIMLGGGIQAASVIHSGGEIGSLAVFAFTLGSLVQSVLWLAALGVRSRENRQAKVMAERANRAKTRILAATGHDLRQPLQAIDLFNQALSSSGLNSRQSHIVGRISLSVEALRAIIDQLLDISRLDAGILQARPGAIRADELIGALRNEFSDSAARKHLSFDIFISERCNCLYTDPRLLQNLLRNLVGNAVKYTGRGGILVGVRRRGERALIQVWDTGIGVAPEAMNRVFEEYFQVDNPERDPEKGFGLGLSIVRRLADILGTEVRMRSRPGKGSVIEISVPLGHAPSVADSPEPASAVMKTA